MQICPQLVKPEQQSGRDALTEPTERPKTPAPEPAPDQEPLHSSQETSRALAGLQQTQPACWRQEVCVRACACARTVCVCTYVFLPVL